MSFRYTAVGGLLLLVGFASACVEGANLGSLDPKPRLSPGPTPTATPTLRPSDKLSGGLSQDGSGQGQAIASPSPTSPPLIPEVLAIELSTTSITLNLNPFSPNGDPIGMREYQIIGVVRYSDDRTSDRLSWRSTDPAIVTVTDGLVRAVSPVGPPPGLATASVIATALDAPTLTATCEVTVKP